MKIKSRKFGEIDIDEEKIITMPIGLPGFPGKKRFALVERAESRPFCWLQSAEDPNVALVLMDPFLFKSDYGLDAGSAFKDLAWEKEEVKDIALYVVLNFHDTGPARITANLMGPIVINTKRREAVQMVLHDSNYSLQHPVLMRNPQSDQQSVANG